ncbi:MAG TPA: hypothetical protein VM261_20970 [Kofleriaceae bacterium]|nr:hypothetical protein [Kofleriaceae bacterium]
MRSLLGLWCLLALAACNQVFGLEPPSERAAVDAPASSDATAIDASPAIDALPPSDARSTDAATDAAVDAAIDAPISSCGARGTPCGSGGYCNGAGACVACTTNSHCGAPQPMQCTMPVCAGNDTCIVGPAPRDTFCNNSADQCDGAGNCVDCTNNGGCGECCACSNQICINV